MNGFYDWLYDHYAEPRLDENDFPPSYHEQKRQWQSAADRLLGSEDLLTWQDYLGAVKAYWGTATFTLGVQVVLFLSPLTPEEE